MPWTLEHFFTSGRVADLVLGVMALEALLLLWRRRRTGQGPTPVDLLAMLGAGAALVLALRLALTGAPWPALAACLMAGGAFHVLDLVRRSKG